MPRQYYDVDIKCPTCGKKLEVYASETTYDSEGNKDFTVAWECPGGCTYDDDVLDTIDNDVNKAVAKVGAPGRFVRYDYELSDGEVGSCFLHTEMDANLEEVLNASVLPICQKKHGDVTIKSWKARTMTPEDHEEMRHQVHEWCEDSKELMHLVAAQMLLSVDKEVLEVVPAMSHVGALVENLKKYQKNRPKELIVFDGEKHAIVRLFVKRENKPGPDTVGWDGTTIEKDDDGGN